jgi:hypothetical protein
LSNLISGLSNTICTAVPSTSSSATSAKPAVVIENYVNGASWYRIWSDGWCEQGGYFPKTWSTTAWQKLYLLKPYKDTNYGIFLQLINSFTASSGNYSTASFSVKDVARDSFYYYCYSAADGYKWRACGFIR